MANDVFSILRPSLTGSRKTIIVLGSPRGGTSMVAATLRKLGVMMGENLGHQHEDRKFRQEVPLAEKIETIKQRNAAYELWGWKLPNTIYFIEDVLPHLVNPHFVAIFRNPFSISRSSAERDNRVYDTNLLGVAINHTKKVVDLLGKLQHPVAMSSFEAVLAQPHEFVAGLADFIGRGSDQEAIDAAAKQAINLEMDYIRFNEKAK